MNINVIRNFLVLAETLNFTKTSDKSFIVQSALSRQIQQLEESIGIKLFKRNKRNVELTAAGRFMKIELTQLIKNFDRVVKKAGQLDRGEAGEVRIGYSHSAMQSFMPAMLRYINNKLPDMSAMLFEMSNKQQSMALLNKEIDIGFSTNPVIQGKLRSRVLAKDNFAVVLPLDHPIDQSNFEDLSVFAHERFILTPQEEAPMYAGTVESIFIDAGFMPLIVHETAFTSIGVRLVEARMGLTIEPVSALRSYSTIKFIELKDIPQKAELTMLWNPELEAEIPQLMAVLKDFDILD